MKRLLAVVTLAVSGCSTYIVDDRPLTARYADPGAGSALERALSECKFDVSKSLGYAVPEVNTRWSTSHEMLRQCMVAKGYRPIP